MRELLQQRKKSEVGGTSPAMTGLLHRKCACWGSPNLDGECKECHKKGLSLRGDLARTAADATTPNSAARSLPAPFPAPPVPGLAASSPGHAFSRVDVLDRTATFEDYDDTEEERTLIAGSTAASRIDFTYDPTTSQPKPHCNRIVFVQIIQMTADGSAIKPGDYYTPWKCRDAIAISDATYIDSSPTCPCSSPYYTDCANGVAGSSNGVTANATSFDSPNTGGGDKKFASPTNPGGWNTVTYNFETYGFCAEGADCGTFYDGVRWTYSKTAADDAAGGSGTSSATASLPPPGPGDPVAKAYDKFNGARGFKPCLMSVLPGVP